MKTFEQLYDKDFKYILDESYTAILDLDDMLNRANIPHELKRFQDGWQVVYPEDGSKRVADAIQHHSSYGGEENLLEIMGLVSPEEADDSVLGCLTAEEVFRRIKEHYEKNK